MGRANAYHLPEHLRKDPSGAYILDFRIDLPDGSRKRVMKSLGRIPKALALKIRDKAVAEQSEGRFFRAKTPKRPQWI